MTLEDAINYTFGIKAGEPQAVLLQLKPLTSNLVDP